MNFTTIEDENQINEINEIKQQINETQTKKNKD